MNPTDANKRNLADRAWRRHSLPTTVCLAWLAPLLATVALVLGGCKSAGNGASNASSQAHGSSGAPALASQTQVTPEARAKAKDIYASRCATCHGAAGKGDGPGAANLTPKPPNFQDQSWQTSVTDQNIEQAILYGGAAVGKSPMMPSNPDLESDPAVVAALRVLVREAGQQAGK